MIQIQCKMIRYQSEVVCLIVGAATVLAWLDLAGLDWSKNDLHSLLVFVSALGGDRRGRRMQSSQGDV